MLKVDVELVDGAYWTLGVEFAFYVTIGLLYFPLGWRKSIVVLVVLWGVSSFLRHYPVSSIGRAVEPLWWAGMDHFGWFASGALFFKAHELRSEKLYFLAIATALVCALTSFLVVAWYDKAVLVGAIALFATSQRSVAVQRWLGSRWLFFAGTISYPLYLLHNHLGVGIIAYLGARADRFSPMIPLMVTAALVLLAYAIHTHVEPRIAAWLKRKLLKVHQARPLP